jgi:hypothetical protein
MTTLSQEITASFSDMLRPDAIYTRMDTVILPHFIVSDELRDKLRKRKPEPELMTYTTVNRVVVEPDVPEKLSEEDIRRMAKMMDDMITREILGPYACSEFEESLRAAKVEPAAKYPGPFINMMTMT